MDEKFKLPKVGARIQKTALAVFLSIMISHFLGGKSPFYACIASVICMQDSYKGTIKMGINRMIGTIIGGLAGIFATFIFFKYNNYYFDAALISLLCIVVTYLCTLLKKPGSVTIACIVLLANTVLIKQEPSYMYTIVRVLETFLGIIVATLVNRFVFPYNPEKNKN